MCGIGGIILSNRRLKFDEVYELASRIEMRGRDAFGFLLLNRYGRVRRYFKLPSPATEVLVELEKLLAPIIKKSYGILMHTRAATFGEPVINRNNHPFKIRHYYFAHNGYCIYTLPEWSKEKIQTDSYNGLFMPLIRHIENGISLKEAVQKSYDEFCATGAFWLYDEKCRTLYLFRESMPLTYNVEPESFRFASTGEQNNIENGQIIEISLPFRGKIKEYRATGFENYSHYYSPTTNRGRGKIEIVFDGNKTKTFYNKRA